jgi:hypothetical protein
MDRSQDRGCGQGSAPLTLSCLCGSGPATDVDRTGFLGAAQACARLLSRVLSPAIEAEMGPRVGPAALASLAAMADLDAHIASALADEGVPALVLGLMSSPDAAQHLMAQVGGSLLILPVSAWCRSSVSSTKDLSIWRRCV